MYTIKFILVLFLFVLYTSRYTYISVNLYYIIVGVKSWSRHDILLEYMISNVSDFLLGYV